MALLPVSELAVGLSVVVFFESLKTNICTDKSHLNSVGYI